MFRAKFDQPAKKLINKIIISLHMKIIKIPDVHYFKHGWVSFNTNRKDRELYYEISIWNDESADHTIMEQGIVKDKEHLNELQNSDNVN